ncbi:hypothetical protein E8A74_21500 [Polyangium fumosum]|uniref:Uncharacterized protein n=1 Tax=Polyangium fumosum TaxID=889272 RepID=A0A4U1J9N2_9BACT|nr:hypothetical protein E8A74_21500 [Polyangium fumosum]
MGQSSGLPHQVTEPPEPPEPPTPPVPPVPPEPPVPPVPPVPPGWQLACMPSMTHSKSEVHPQIVQSPVWHSLSRPHVSFTPQSLESLQPFGFEQSPEGHGPSFHSPSSS